MITSQQAQDLILKYCNASLTDDIFVVYFCELSPKQDYWIIRCNSERYVIHNQLEHYYVGVNAYLVNTSTGKIDIVGSGDNVEDFLQDIYDTQTAGSQFYILRPTFTKESKVALLQLKQWISCGYIDAINLLTINQAWFTGKRRDLQHIQTLLKIQNIDTDIILVNDIKNAVIIDNDIWFEQDVRRVLSEKIYNTLNH